MGEENQRPAKLSGAVEAAGKPEELEPTNPLRYINAPAKIWLQPEPEDAGWRSAPPAEFWGEGSWCDSKVNPNDAEYIRADLAAAPDLLAAAKDGLGVLCCLLDDPYADSTVIALRAAITKAEVR